MKGEFNTITYEVAVGGVFSFVLFDLPVLSRC